MALDVLHDVIVNAVLATDTVDRHNVGMMERGGGVRFDLETLKMLLVESGREGQRLECDATLQGKLHGFINDAHAAPTDLTHDLVIAQN